MATHTFTLNDPNIVHARNDRTLYWSTAHGELTDAALFSRASSTRRRLMRDIESAFHDLTPLTRLRWRHGRRPSDPEPDERLQLRLAGRAQAGSDQVVMTDSVWVLCCDMVSVRAVEARLRVLAWLRSGEYAPVYVYVEGLSGNYVV
ncbi:hypothetical protein GGS24DRAFT_503801 [Hypoxylon argillaceum]|nr:hypothetical protein GGS24DRAFT_503801 [Hypoxylon argillaceum]